MDAYLTAVQKALNHIEDHLRKPLSLEDVSRKAGFSLWHFQRTFTALVGEPLGSYLRRRRLTVAAGELRESSRRILDIALDYQFESQEAFTRAFKSLFGVTPGGFRKNRQLEWIKTRPVITTSSLKHLSRNTAIDPQIITLPALTLIGLETRFIGAMSPDANNLSLIPPLFDKFGSSCDKLPSALDGFTYGACNCLPENQRTREDELVYLVSKNVAPNTPVPNEMKAWQVPALTYAHFTHRGPISKINETIYYAYGGWLPRSKFERVDAPELERYDNRFGDGGEECELDYLIPVKET